MKKLDAYSVSIGVLAVVDTYLTATIIPVPVWVTFIAWASFFILGGKFSGLKQSIASNLTGVVISSLTLLTIAAFGSHPIVAAVCVGIWKRSDGPGLQASAAKRDPSNRLGLCFDRWHYCSDR